MPHDPRRILYSEHIMCPVWCCNFLLVHQAKGVASPESTSAGVEISTGKREQAIDQEEEEI